MNDRARFGAALGLLALGGAGALLASGRAWQTVTAPRPRPFGDAVVDVSGRTLEPAVAALGVVALAGVVAALATRGIVRRIVGGLLVAAAIGLTGAAVAGMQSVSAHRARSLVADARTAAGLDPTRAPHVTVHAVWPLLVLICALAVLLGGAAIAVWGHRGVALSSRYEAPAARASADAQRTSTALWNDLDRGHDPTGESRSSTPDSGR
ncbi:MAG TPA: Trp biosynthesis-associated membrane protein [Jatrophihabitantaceae bacterium]